MATAQQLEQAITYFSNLRIPQGKPFKLVPGTPEIREYTRHLLIAQDAALGLEKYGLRGLEHLTQQGFYIPMAVMFGVSQKTVDGVFLLLEHGIAAIEGDDREQIVRVLSTYKEIFPLEVMVTDPRKFKEIKAIEKALQMSR